MIRKLEVEGLNNRLDGAWEFNEDLNIITGRNGSGKTTLLKLIWYLISGNIEQIISDIPFQSVSIKTDSFSLSIIQLEDRKVKLDCEFANNIKVDRDFEIPLRGRDNEQINTISVLAAGEVNSLFFPTFRRIEGGFARFSRYVVDDDSVTYPPNRFRRRFVDRATEMLQDAMSRLSGEVSAFDDHKFVASISTDDIAKLLTEKYAHVSEKTNELHANLSKDITQKISERKSSDDPNPILDSIQKRVEEDNKEKDLLLRPFSVLGERIRDIFQYNGIRLTAARITLGEVKEAIESDKLSAGEKQLLSFLCYNTFSEKAAIFIDEPELSLHVDWQRRLLPTLLEQETGNQFFVATHSPFIYGKYPDKEIQLHEDRGGE